MHRCADDLITRRHALLVDKKASARTSVRTPTPAAPARMLLRPARPPAYAYAYACFTWGAMRSISCACADPYGAASRSMPAPFSAPAAPAPSILTRSCGSWDPLQHVQHQI